MVIFVTGATGFIGYNLVEKLLTAGHKVVALARPDSHNYKELLDNRVSFTYDSSIQGLTYVFTEHSVECIVHLASLFISEHKPEDIEPLISSNILLGTNILEAMQLSGCKNIINTGTSWQHYNNEEYRATCLYAATKEAFQKIIDFYADAYEINSISLELFDSYGRNDHRKKLLFLLKNTYLNQAAIEMSLGEQYIELLHVNDIVDAFIHSMGLLHDGVNERYMVTGNRAIQIKELIAIIEKILGEKLPVTLGGRPYRQREIMVPWNAGKPLPNWQPKISLEDGLKDYFLD